MLKEERVITPTIRALLDGKARKHSELFLLVPLSLLEKVAPLGPNASFLYVILYSTHRMQPRVEYFSVQSEFEAAVGRGYRWWHRHTRTLEEAGLVEVRRKDGAKPRYRLLGTAARRRHKDLA